ncbi:MAG TPA: DUF3592 domain-containing protein [Pyrinomonadaceae bacterium]|nr:DUF3592 domain-containing protein [Pyrinomonadaceae bacterium]
MDYSIFLIGGGQLLLGTTFFAVSIFLIIRKILRMKKWAKTKGVVLDVKISQGTQQPMGTTRNTLFKPKVRFQTADGQVIDYEPKTSNNWSNYNVGQEIDVYYDPQQPSNVMFGKWFGLIMPAVVGGFFALSGAIFLLINLVF